MKEVLETIPVWDALKEDTECPICSLMMRAEEDALKYYLGPAVMVPEIRVQINSKGYCNEGRCSEFCAPIVPLAKFP